MLGNKKGRELNVELLRLVLKLMLISQHVLYHATDFYHIISKGGTVEGISAVQLVLYVFVACAVNCFVFILGFME